MLKLGHCIHLKKHLTRLLKFVKIWDLKLSQVQKSKAITTTLRLLTFQKTTQLAICKIRFISRQTSCFAHKHLLDKSEAWKENNHQSKLLLREEHSELIVMPRIVQYFINLKDLLLTKMCHSLT